MTQKEYLEGLKEIDCRRDAERRGLVQEWVEQNAMYRVGETIEDSSGKILTIRKVHGQIFFWVQTPQIYYTGIELTKKLKPKKYQGGGCIDECRVVKKIKLEEK